MLTFFIYVSFDALLVHEYQFDKAVVIAVYPDTGRLIDFVPVVFKIELGARMQMPFGQRGYL